MRALLGRPWRLSAASRALRRKLLEARRTALTHGFCMFDFVQGEEVPRKCDTIMLGVGVGDTTTMCDKGVGILTCWEKGVPEALM